MDINRNFCIVFIPTENFKITFSSLHRPNNIHKTAWSNPAGHISPA